MKPFLLIVTLAMNLIFPTVCSCYEVIWIRICWAFLSWIIIILQWNNECFVFSRCGYSTMNHVMCPPLVPIIIIFERSLLNYSTMKIMFTMIVYGRLWLIIIWIVWLPIMFWYFLLKWSVLGTTIFWPNGWHITTDWWPGTYNYNKIIF